ncbi:MAG: Holliday junction branch migration protein RuvA [Acidimicrobiales bacterium]
MIGYLRGTVVETEAVTDSAVEILLDVNGVGYRILVAPRVAAGLAGKRGVGLGPGAAGTASNGHGGAAAQAALSIHTHVREGAITLYGFADSGERRAFEILLGAHGVGPALALAIVAVHPPARLVDILASDDVESLTLVPGVGRKTALRLLVDLRARAGDLDGSYLTTGSDSSGKLTAAAEVADALAQLGWGSEDVRNVVRDLPAEGTTEELLRVALRELARRR